MREVHRTRDTALPNGSMQMHAINARLAPREKQTTVKTVRGAARENVGTTSYDVYLASIQ